MLPARRDPPRIARRAAPQVVEARPAAAVDEVAHASPGGEALIVVVVPREHEADAVALEQRYPACHDGAVRLVLAAGVTPDDGRRRASSAPENARACVGARWSGRRRRRWSRGDRARQARSRGGSSAPASAARRTGSDHPEHGRRGFRALRRRGHRSGAATRSWSPSCRGIHPDPRCSRCLRA